MKIFKFNFINLSKLTAIIFIIFTVQSCIKDNFDFDKLSHKVELNPNIAVPIVNSSLTLRDVVQDYDKNELFEEDANGFLYLMYQQQIYSSDGTNIFSIPSQNITESYLAPSNINLTTGTYSYTDSTVQDFSVNNSARIDSIILNSAQLSFSISSSQTLNGTITLILPTVKKNGIPYAKTVDFSSGIGNYNDLDGYKIDLTKDSPNYNKLPVYYTINLNNSPATFLTGDEMFSATVSIDSINYKTVYGFLGQQTVAIPDDSVHIDIFDHAFQGNLFFKDPKFKFQIKNSFGIPLQFQFDTFRTYTVASQTYEYFQFPIQYSPLNVNYPSISQIGQSKETYVTLDTLSFPEIRNLIETNPKYIKFGVTSMFNITDPGTNNNFIMDTSKFSVDLKVELPLWGHASYFVLQDTFDLDMSDVFKNTDEIDWINFRLNIDNGMPTEVGTQVYFCDSLYNVIDSLFDPNNMQIIESGVLDAAGKVVQSTHKTTDVKYTKERIDPLENCKYIFVRGYLHTTDKASRLVRFYSNYDIRVKFGIQAEGKLTTNF